MADKQPTAAQILAAAPPPATVGTSRPLGVPADYQGPGKNPLYFDDDVFVPASLAPEKIAQLQGRMETAGLIRKGTRYRRGVWDDVSRDAYRALLETANVYGVDETRALGLYAQSQPNIPERDPLNPAPTNPADIQATVRTAARALYGHKADEGLVSRIVAGFQAAEQNAATGTVSAPNVSSYVNQQLEQADPQAVAADRGLEVGNTILQAFMNPAGTLDTGGG